MLKKEHSFGIPEKKLYFCTVLDGVMREITLKMLIVALLSAVSLSVSAQLLRANKQQKFPKDIPAGNYSGITPIGGDRYAVVSDKTSDGFYVFRIDIDTVRGRILGVTNEGFRTTGRPTRDQEGIAWNPQSQSLFISGEADNHILEYNLDGQQTGRQLQMPSSFSRLGSDYGLESLCYDAEAHRYYTINERPAKGDSLLWLMAFGDDGRLAGQYAYKLDPVPSKRRGTLLNGVSEVCAIGNGRLLVLERTLRIPPLKIGSYAECRLYMVNPSGSQPLTKTHLYTFRTHINLLRRNFANYEGLCVAHRLSDGSLILLLVADSQNQHRGILRDWLKTIVITNN